MTWFDTGQVLSYIVLDGYHGYIFLQMVVSIKRIFTMNSRQKKGFGYILSDILPFWNDIFPFLVGENQIFAMRPRHYKDFLQEYIIYNI